MSTIRYFLPEDGDTEETPNVFLAPKPNRAGYPPLLGQIKNAFPLPGIYHFRFKTALIPGSDRDKNAVAVWMDCVDDAEPVPTWQSSVVAKVTRVDVADDEESYDGEFARADSTASTGGYSSSRSSIQSSKPQSAVNNSSQHSSASLLGAFDEPIAPAPPAPAASLSTGNLLDGDHHPPAPAPPASGGSLLDMDHIGAAPSSGYTSSGANTPTPHDELLNMTAPMPTNVPAGGAQPVPPQYPLRAHPQQQQRPSQPMQGQFPMKYPPQGQQGLGGSMPGQQRMGMMHGQHAMGMQQMQGQGQQFNNQSAPRGSMANGSGNNKNAFDKFSGSTLDPLGSLKWG